MLQRLLLCKTFYQKYVPYSHDTAPCLYDTYMETRFFIFLCALTANRISLL